MQLMLPLFPNETKLITPTLGVFKKDELVYYLHCGVPIYSHAVEDIKSFRYITSKFIVERLCRKIEISECFGISYDSVKGYVKLLQEEGDAEFFSNEKRHGYAHKLLPEVVERIQKSIDEGKNNCLIGREEGLSEGAIRYGIKTGKLKKELTLSSPSTLPTNRAERSIIDSTTPMGIDVARQLERIECSIVQHEEAQPIFERSDNVCQAGVLFLLPSLILQGLLKGKDIDGKLKNGYYGLVSMLLALAYMSLSRIKTPEALKLCKPGEFGKIIGLDRVPEVKCLRGKIEEIVEENKAKEFNSVLAQRWISDDQCAYFYIDGHVRIYHGDKAKLTKKYVSGEKLCLAGTTEFWVNNELGLPYLGFAEKVRERQTYIYV